MAPHEAARLWRAALDRAGDDVRERLDLIMGLVRALAVTGALAQAREHRAEAVTLAESLGDPVLTASVLGAFDVPAVWTANDDPELAARIVTVVEKTLVALPPERRAERARLLATLTLELRNTGGDRGREAAFEAEALARELGVRRCSRSRSTRGSCRRSTGPGWRRSGHASGVNWSTSPRRTAW